MPATILDASDKTPSLLPSCNVGSGKKEIHTMCKKITAGVMNLRGTHEGAGVGSWVTGGLGRLPGGEESWQGSLLSGVIPYPGLIPT